MTNLIDKKNIDFKLELIHITAMTGESSCIYSEMNNLGKKSSIYDYSVLMRVLYSKGEIINEEILNDLYSSSDNHLAFILKMTSFEMLVCIVELPKGNPESFGKVISILKKSKIELLNKSKPYLPNINTPTQSFNSGVRLFPRYNTSRLNAEISIVGVSQEIKLFDASVGGICIESPTPSVILENTKKIRITFSKFKYEFLTTVKWTHTDQNRNTKAGIKIDFQSKQELSNWQTFVYALYIKQKVVTT